MKIPASTGTSFLFILLSCPLLLVLSLSGCGGGSSGSGSGSGTAGTFSGELVLTSITFPEFTNLTGGGATPPDLAPLTQQVVLTFSKPVKGDVSPSCIYISADPGLEYTGPEIALDKTKNLIPARGTMEVLDNLIVFTPQIPRTHVDLSANALPENVPGLLPGFTYTVFVPVQTSGAVPGLAGVDAGVTNPVKFTTTTVEGGYFANQPKVPPQVVSVTPADGTVDFSLNTKSDLSTTILGFPVNQEIVLEFDQPLDFSTDNLEGEDVNGNGVRDQNMFLSYVDPVMHVIVDKAPLGFIATMNADTADFEQVGYTRTTDGDFKRLKTVILTETFDMIGCDGQSLFDVAYQDPTGTPPNLFCLITNERALAGVTHAIGLCFTRENELYALDSGNGSLLRIAVDTGALEDDQVLTSAAPGEYVDMTLRRDNELYALKVVNPGSPAATCTIEKINRIDFTCTPIISGLIGDYTALGSIRGDRVTLYESSSNAVVQYDMTARTVVETHMINDPLLPAGAPIDFDFKRYELGVIPQVLESSYHGSTVRLTPSGILPMGAWLDIELRNSLANLSQGSLVQNLGYPVMGCRSVATIKTYDPGAPEIYDYYQEDFLTNDMEETVHEMANARALWNVHDTDGELPEYKHLLASLGLSGSGELGDFRPKSLGGAGETMVVLDTDYQPLPLYNGATPDIVKPVIVTGGEFHFHDIIIPDNVTVRAQGSNPLVFSATGTVDIAGTLDVAGRNGANDVTFNSAFIPTPGGVAGPGGGSGGRGQPTIPENFQALTQLQSAPRGESGFGMGNRFQNGGQGGETGAKKPPKWKASQGDLDSRGAGGGGGTYLQMGLKGFIGRGEWGVDEEGNFYKRSFYNWWSGSYKYNASWNPGDPIPDSWKNNYYHVDNGTEIQWPVGGLPGEAVFKDLDGQGDPDTSNDFIGWNGELTVLQGGQGGGGGGSRLDSLAGATKNAAALKNPPVARSAFDAKGGGGGGGGGAVAIHCLGDILIRKTGVIDARGGRGGGGEVIGHSNFGGGGGGGSGGAIILNSATAIRIEHDALTPEVRGWLRVDGGKGNDARATIKITYDEIVDTCQIDPSDGTLIDKTFCSYGIGDGGYGGYGLIQLMVPNPVVDLEMPGWPGGDPDELISVQATLVVINHDPNFEKHNVSVYNEFYSRYEQTVLFDGTDWYKVEPTTTDCLIDPHKTPSTISSRSYAVSRWIDMGQIVNRPSLGGFKPPVFWIGNLGFKGVEPSEDWAVVSTISGSGYLPDASLPPTHVNSNDIEVELPDLGKLDFIDPTNEVALQFQGTDAVIPGSKVPDEDALVITDWTHDLSSLQGKQFIRFKVRLDVAKGGVELEAGNLKPQVNKVRLRFKY